jgi:hypothetical protein
MKKNFITVFLALCIALVPISALADWQGIHVWTGEEWQALEQEEKHAFIRGMVEGLKFRGPDMGPWEPVTEDLEEYIPEMDAVYENPENIDLPVVLILDYVNSKFAGMDQEMLDLRLEELRRIAEENRND